MGGTRRNRRNVEISGKKPGWFYLRTMAFHHEQSFFFSASHWLISPWGRWCNQGERWFRKKQGFTHEPRILVEIWGWTWHFGCICHGNNQFGQVNRNSMSWDRGRFHRCVSTKFFLRFKSPRISETWDFTLNVGRWSLDLPRSLPTFPTLGFWWRF